MLKSVEVNSAIVAVAFDDQQLSEKAMGWRDSGLTVREVRGRKMVRLEGLMDEFAAALQFPHYFGEKWSAFQECLEDMDWLPQDAGIVVVVSDATEVLSAEPIADLRTLIESISRAAATYATPISEGEWGDRAAIPFHAILQGGPGGDFSLVRWRDAGAVLSVMD